MARTALQQIANIVAKKHHLSVKETDKFIDNIFEVINEGLDADKLTKVKGLGTFKVQAVKPRESINVNTGERVLIKGHNKVTFTPDNDMKELVNKPFAQFETVVLNEGVDFEDLEDETTDRVLQSEETEIKKQKNKEISEKEDVLQDGLSENQTEEIAKETVESNENPTAIAAVNGNDVVTENEGKPATEEAKNKDMEPVSEVAEHYEETTPNVSKTEIVNEEKRAEGVTADDESQRDIRELIAEEKQKLAATAQTGDSNVAVPKKKAIWIVLTVACLLVVVIWSTYLLGLHNFGAQSTDLITQKKEQEEQKSNTENSRNTDNSSSATANNHAGVKQTNEASQMKIPSSQSAENYKALSSDPRIRYGAYDIVGIEKTVILKKGETMASYSKKTLGADMVGYFQVLNGVEAMGEGDTLKVPKVDLRPEYKQSKNNGEKSIKKTKQLFQ